MNRAVWLGCRLTVSFICPWLSKVPRASRPTSGGSPSKHDTSTQCCINVVSASKTVDQHCTTTHCPMLLKCWASVVDSVLALTQHYVSVSCSLCTSQSSRAYQTRWLAYVYRYVLHTKNTLLERYFFLLNSTSMYNQIIRGVFLWRE